MGHEVLHAVASMEAAYSAEVDPEVAYPRRQLQLAAQQELVVE